MEMKNYFKNAEGQFHREDGPAIEYSDGTKLWFYHGTRHRLDGPAIERVDGSKEYFINGDWYGYDDLTTKEFMRYLKAVKEWKKKN